MLSRVLEPEVMDTAEEAHDYDAMDHGSVNARFCDDLLASEANEPSEANGSSEANGGGVVLDVGTGTALIPIELCKRSPHRRIVAIDLAEHMLALGKMNIARANLDDRIRLEKIDAKKMPYDDGAFATTISNSIVHHIPNPLAVIAEMVRVTKAGGLIFVRDLARPDSDAEVDRLVALYGGEPPADALQRKSFQNQRELFRASLKAALTVDEIAAMAEDTGMHREAIRMTSDRHWTLCFRKAL